MKTSNFKFSALLILPAALLLQSAPIRATESEAAVSSPVSAALILPAALLLIEYAPPQAPETEAAPCLPVSTENPVPPSPLVEWLGLRDITEEEPPAAIPEFPPPLDLADSGSLSAPELPPLVVESPPLLPLFDTGWPANIIEAEDLSDRLGIDPVPQPLEPRFGEAYQRWFDSVRR